MKINFSYRHAGLSFRSARGNALFLILIAVALFAALSYAVTKSGRGGGGIDKEKAQLTAGRFLSYGASLTHVIQRMRIAGGCNETQLNFANSVQVHPDYWGGTTNTTAPADGSCDVFGTAGMPYWNAGSDFPSGSWLEVAQNVAVVGVGTSAPELVLWSILERTTAGEQICAAINSKMNNTGDVSGGTIRTLSWSYARGAGLTFDTPVDMTTIADDPLPSAFDGKIAGCLDGGTSHEADRMIFYYVLLER